MLSTRRRMSVVSCPWLVAGIWGGQRASDDGQRTRMDFIDLDHVSRWYGTQRALHEVTVKLPPGRIGLLGPNGAGKSTLLKILLGLLPPSSGRGAVQGYDLAGDGTALRRAIGYMPEGDTLVPGMAGAEYVALAGELYGMPRRQALRRAHEVRTSPDLDDARH